VDVGGCTTDQALSSVVIRPTTDHAGIEDGPVVEDQFMGSGKAVFKIHAPFTKSNATLTWVA